MGRVAVIGGTSETWLVGLLSRSWEIPTVNDDARGQRSANMVFAGVETSNEFIIQGPLANGLVWSQFGSPKPFHNGGSGPFRGMSSSSDLGKMGESSGFETMLF